MENNEDEPDDVKKARPVESAVLNGNKDEKKETIKGKKPKSAPASLNDSEESKRKRCNLYRGKFPAPVPKTNKKPCHPKAEIICRDNLSKVEYIDVLSAPKKSRGLSCKLVDEQPKLESMAFASRRFSSSGKTHSCKEKAAFSEPISERLKELAKPNPMHLMDLLQTWGSKLRPEIIDGVQKSLEENFAMSPEQMEAYYNEKDREDCGRVRRVRRKKCPGKNKRKKSPCDDHMDQQAVCEEYEMAQRFMRHIISRLKNSPFSPEDHYDLTEVILSQLGSVLDYRPSGDGDRKFQMMFMLANGIACWVHGLNLAVAEKFAEHQTEDDKEAIGTEESEDEDAEEEEPKEEYSEPTEEEDEEEEAGEVEEKEEEEEEEEEEAGEVEEKEEEEEEEEVEEAKEGEEENEPETDLQSEPTEEEIIPELADDNDSSENQVQPGPKEEYEISDADEETSPEVNAKEELVGSENAEEEKDSTDTAEEKEEIEKAEPEMEEEFQEEGQIEYTNEVEDESPEEIAEEEGETVEDIALIESDVEPGLAIQGLGEGDLFASEIPFLTFGKIMKIVVKFLEKFEEAETSEVRRRLQNAILEKLTTLVLAEAPDALDDNTKAILEVLAENIAVFMENTLPKSEVNEIETMAPEIESTEVRDWGHWLETVMDNATNWGKWIHEKVGEAEEKARTKVTRGDWQDWTSTINCEALRWRRFNLDTKHRMHHADLNLTHKKVVHRGGMRSGKSMRSTTLAPYPEKDETEMNVYSFSDEAPSLDQRQEITEYEESET